MSVQMSESAHDAEQEDFYDDSAQSKESIHLTLTHTHQYLPITPPFHSSSPTHPLHALPTPCSTCPVPLPLTSSSTSLSVVSFDLLPLSSSALPSSCSSAVVRV